MKTELQPLLSMMELAVVVVLLLEAKLAINLLTQLALGFQLITGY
jgi:hypothetical protein